MRRNLSIVPVVVLTLFVSLALESVSQAEWIFTNRRNASTSGGVFQAVMNAYDLDTKADKTPTGFSSSYTEGFPIEGLAYYDGTLYVGGGTGSSNAGVIRAYNAATGAALTPITVDSTQTIRGIVADSSGNIYASYNNGGVGKVLANGTVLNTWGTDGYDGGADIEIYNNTIYVGSTNSSTKGVYTYSSSGGSASILSGTSGTKVIGLTFDGDGTLYTVGDGGYVYKWTYDGSSYSKTSIADLTTYSNDDAVNAGKDVDYYDGCLYISCTDRNATMSSIFKVDLTDNNALTLWQTAPSSTYGDAAYLCITPSQIPEPSTLALLGCGLIGLLAYAWRKRK